MSQVSRYLQNITNVIYLLAGGTFLFTVAWLITFDNRLVAVPIIQASGILLVAGFLMDLVTVGIDLCLKIFSK